MGLDRLEGQSAEVSAVHGWKSPCALESGVFAAWPMTAARLGSQIAPLARSFEMWVADRDLLIDAGGWRARLMLIASLMAAHSTLFSRSAASPWSHHCCSWCPRSDHEHRDRQSGESLSSILEPCFADFDALNSTDQLTVARRLRLRMDWQVTSVHIVAPELRITVLDDAPETRSMADCDARGLHRQRVLEVYSGTTCGVEGSGGCVSPTNAARA